MAIPVLMYHIVDTNIDSKISVEPKLFEEQIQTLFQAGFKTVTLSEYLQFIQIADMHNDKILITFDDGYECFYRNAWPVLRKYGYSATQFVMTGWIGQTNWWNPKARYLVKHLNWQQIAALANDGCEIGAHTTNHQSLVKLSEAQVHDNILFSKMAIEDNIEKPVISFSYPYGDFNKQARKIVSDLFQIAFSVDQGQADPSVDKFTINRISIDNRTTSKHLVNTISLYNTVKAKKIL